MMMNDLKSKPEEILKDAERIYSDAKIKTKEVLHSGKEKMEFETERLKSSVKTGLDAYNEKQEALIKKMELTEILTVILLISASVTLYCTDLLCLSDC
ncbi:MAG: hypothetical protein MZV64_51110 [Ignavibacteriales bacterium]|nr:hypothetical protein [Ignavibacteriales bacterium]